MGQRVDLDAGAAFGLEKLELRALPALKPFAPGDPGVERCERVLQRLRFAQVAAGIGVTRMQVALGVMAAIAVWLARITRRSCRPSLAETSCW